MLFVWFELDQATFASALCENLDWPELECYGKCQLPQLVEDQPAEGKASASLQVPKTAADFFLQPTIRHIVQAFTIERQVLLPNFPFFYEFLPLEGIFRPPRRYPS